VAEANPTPAAAPAAGLVNVSGTVAGDIVSGSLDSLVDLIAVLQNNDAQPPHILLDPLGWAQFRKLKTGETYNSTLLGAGTTDAQQLLLSLPVIVDKAVPDFTGIVVDRNAVVSAVGTPQVATSVDQ
jgi:hypothetical protein